MRLEYRFTAILVVCLLLGMIAAGLISYRIETRQAEDEIIQNAEMLMETAMAIRSYTISEVRPLLRKHPSDEFLPQTVPSYSAQTALGKLKNSFPDFNYREAALNPTNVADRASDWEVGLIRRFQAEPDTRELSGTISHANGERYYIARPIRITNPACLSCHSTPEAAPPAMIAKYGAANGFGWKVNEVVGAQIVEVPVTRAWKAAKSSITITLGALLCIFLLTFVIFLAMFRRYVTRPLESITRNTEEISLDKRPDPNAPQVGGQFKTLEQAIDRLRVSVDHAISIIGRDK